MSGLQGELRMQAARVDGEETGRQETRLASGVAGAGAAAETPRRAGQIFLTCAVLRATLHSAPP